MIAPLNAVRKRQPKREGAPAVSFASEDAGERAKRQAADAKHEAKARKNHARREKQERAERSRAAFEQRVPRIRIYLRTCLVLSIVLFTIGGMLLGSFQQRERFVATLSSGDGPIELELVDVDLVFGLGAADGPALIARGVVGRGDIVQAGARSLKVVCASKLRCQVVLEVAAGATLPSMEITSYEAVRTITGADCVFPFKSGGEMLYACTSSGASAPHCQVANGEMEACEVTAAFIDGRAALQARSPFARDLIVRSVRNMPEDGSDAVPLAIDGALTVRGGRVDVRLRGLSARQVVVSVYEGVLELPLLDAREVSLRTGRLETLSECTSWQGGGDVLVTTASRPMALQYEAARGSCVAAKALAVNATAEECIPLKACSTFAESSSSASGAADSTEDANSTSTAASASSSVRTSSSAAAGVDAVCYGVASLCTDGDADGCGGGGEGEMRLSVAQGNGALQLTAGSSLATPSAMSTYSLGGESVGLVRLDRAAQLALSEVRDWVDEMPTAPAILTVRLDGPGQRSLGYFYFTTSPPYALLEPHWLAAFSASLLQPRARWLAVRAARPTCPYAPLHPINSQHAAAQISHALRTALGVLPAERLLLNSVADNSTVFWHARQSSTGLWPTPSRLPSFGTSVKHVKHEYRLISAGSWTITQLQLSKDGVAIILAVTFSLALSAIVSLVACVGLRYARTAHKRAYWRSIGDIDRLKRTEAALNKEANAAAIAAGGRGADPLAPPPATSAEPARPLAAAAEPLPPLSKTPLTKLPGLPPLMLVELLFDELRKKNINSLELFTKFITEQVAQRDERASPAAAAPYDADSDADDGIESVAPSPTSSRARRGSSFDGRRGSVVGAAGGGVGAAASAASGGGDAGTSPEGDAPPELWVELSTIQGVYEGFCYARNYKVIDLRVRNSLFIQNVFSKRGCRIVHVCDHSTDAYRGIVLVTQPTDSTVKPLPEEDSLRFFLRTCCKFTGKRMDILRASDLAVAYDRFCLRHDR